MSIYVIFCKFFGIKAEPVELRGDSCIGWCCYRQGSYRLWGIVCTHLVSHVTCWLISSSMLWIRLVTAVNKNYLRKASKVLLFEYEYKYEYDFVCALDSHCMEIGYIYFSVLAKIGMHHGNKRKCHLYPSRSQLTLEAKLQLSNGTWCTYKWLGIEISKPLVWNGSSSCCSSPASRRTSTHTENVRSNWHI